MIERKLNVGHLELLLIPLQYYRNRVCLIEGNAGAVPSFLQASEA
jgi:hypothetical protein